MRLKLCSLLKDDKIRQAYLAEKVAKVGQIIKTSEGDYEIVFVEQLTLTSKSLSKLKGKVEKVNYEVGGKND